jgi:hypothetical protein
MWGGVLLVSHFETLACDVDRAGRVNGKNLDGAKLTTKPFVPESKRFGNSATTLAENNEISSIIFLGSATNEIASRLQTKVAISLTVVGASRKAPGKGKRLRRSVSGVNFFHHPRSGTALGIVYASDPSTYNYSSDKA